MGVTGNCPHVCSTVSGEGHGSTPQISYILGVFIKRTFILIKFLTHFENKTPQNQITHAKLGTIQFISDMQERKWAVVISPGKALLNLQK